MLMWFDEKKMRKKRDSTIFCRRSRPSTFFNIAKSSWINVPHQIYIHVPSTAFLLSNFSSRCLSSRSDLAVLQRDSAIHVIFQFEMKVRAKVRRQYFAYLADWFFPDRLTRSRKISLINSSKLFY